MKFIIDVSRSHLSSQADLNSLPVNMRYDPISWMCINRGNCTFHQLNQDTPEHERAAFSSYFKRTGLNPGMSQTVGTCVIYLCVCVSPSVVSDCVWPHGLKPTRLLWPWNSPGKNTGVGSHSLFQGSSPRDLSHLEIKPGSPALEAGSSPSEPPGKPVHTCMCAYVL